MVSRSLIAIVLTLTVLNLGLISCGQQNAVKKKEQEAAEQSNKIQQKTDQVEQTVQQSEQRVNQAEQESNPKQ